MTMTVESLLPALASRNTLLAFGERVCSHPHGWHGSLPGLPNVVVHMVDHRYVVSTPEPRGSTAPGRTFRATLAGLLVGGQSSATLLMDVGAGGELVAVAEGRVKHVKGWATLSQKELLQFKTNLSEHGWLWQGCPLGPALMPPRRVWVPAGDGVEPNPGWIVGWDSRTLGGGFVVALGPYVDAGVGTATAAHLAAGWFEPSGSAHGVGTDGDATCLSAPSSLPGRVVVTPGDLASLNPGTDCQLKALQQWFTAPEALDGAKDKPQAVVQVG
jgi:hypothetical protein